MFWTILFFTVVAIIAIFIIVITIYYHKRPKQSEDNHYDTIVQLDLHKSRIENATDYALNNFKNVSVIVLHHPNPEYVHLNGEKYQLSLYNTRKRRICGFKTFYGKKHYVLVNKNNYTIEEETTFETKDAEITKLVCIDANFEHIKFNIFVVTISPCSDLENLTINIYELIAQETENVPFLIIGNFGSQHWEICRKKTLNDCISSGTGSIPTYKLGTHVSQIHGFISSNKHFFTYVHSIHYIQPHVIHNELVSVLKLHINYNLTEMKFDDNAIKLATVINNIESDENWMKYPREPNSLDKYEHINFKISNTKRKLPPIKSIEQILNDVIGRHNN